MQKKIRTEEKAALRRQLLDCRESMAPPDRREKSSQICSYILQWAVYQQAEQILAYMPVRGEVSLLPVMKSALRHGKRLYLPRVTGKEMEFYQTADLEDLEQGAFGIPEPAPRIPLTDPTGLVLVPGVGFDPGGNRMGYGGGYYDRYLLQNPGFFTAGVCYERQLQEKIPKEEWDVPLQAVITEKGIYQNNKQAQKMRECMKDETRR